MSSYEGLRLRVAWCLLALTGSLAVADTVLVDPGGMGDYLTIQAALDWAPDGVTILVEPGTYSECLEIDGRTGVLRSTDPNDWIIVESSDYTTCPGGTPIVDIQDSTVQLLYIEVFSPATLDHPCISITDSTVDLQRCNVLEGNLAGVDIIGASDVDMTHVTIDNGPASTAISVDSNGLGTLMLAYVAMNGHSGVGGRGLYCPADEVDVDIRDCTVLLMEPVSGHGAGMYFGGGDVSITRTNIAGCNSPNGNGGGILYAPVMDMVGFLNVTDSTFLSNSAAYHGGGVYVESGLGTPATFDGCILAGNHAGDGTAAYGGGGICVDSTTDQSCVIDNCEFYSNTLGSLSTGSAVLCFDTVAGPLLSNSLLCGNDLPYIDGAWNDGGGNSLVDSCQQGACCVSLSCTVTAQSGCQDMDGTWYGAGSDCSVISCPADADGACCMAAYCLEMSAADCLVNEGEFAGASVTCASVTCGEFDGEPHGACCTVEGDCMSLTELLCTAAGGTWQGADTPCCSDTCQEEQCPEDVDGNGEVDVNDLLQLIGAWGFCA